MDPYKIMLKLIQSCGNQSYFILNLTVTFRIQDFSNPYTPIFFFDHTSNPENSKNFRPDAQGQGALLLLQPVNHQGCWLPPPVMFAALVTCVYRKIYKIM